MAKQDRQFAEQIDRRGKQVDDKRTMDDHVFYEDHMSRKKKRRNRRGRKSKRDLVPKWLKDFEVE